MCTTIIFVKSENDLTISNNIHCWSHGIIVTSDSSKLVIDTSDTSKLVIVTSDTSKLVIDTSKPEFSYFYHWNGCPLY